MKVLLTTSKTLNIDSQIPKLNFSCPIYIEKSRLLLEKIRLLNKNELSKLLKTNDKLTELNYERFKEMKLSCDNKFSRPAIYTFKGAVYKPFELKNYTSVDMGNLQEKVRILSGFYGILRPLDLIGSYRFEMGTDTKKLLGMSLYEFWKELVTNNLNQDEGELIVNLASKEYYDVLDKKKLNAKFITPVFKDNISGKYKIVAIYAKTARGTMAEYIVRNNVDSIDGLKKFNVLGYSYNPDESTDTELIFYR